MSVERPKFPAWLFYCLLAIAMWGVWGIVMKSAEREVSAATIQVVSTLGVVPAGLVLLLSPSIRRGRNFLVGGLSAFATGLCGSVGNLLVLLSLSKGAEASTVVPLTGMFPLVTVLLAVVLLRERINWVQCGGIALALVALYLFNRQTPAGATASWSQKLVSDWMALALGALVLWGVAGVLQKVATNHISTELSTLLFAVAFVPVAVVVALTQPVQWRISAWGWTMSLAFGALIGVGTLVLFAAYRTGKASVVTALYALYPAVTVLLARPIFNERIDLWKGVAIVLALGAGVALTFETPAGAAQGAVAPEPEKVGAP
jgi:drug/metabolite transporter (DMT)-like permease